MFRRFDSNAAGLKADGAIPPSPGVGQGRASGSPACRYDVRYGAVVPKRASKLADGRFRLNGEGKALIAEKRAELRADVDGLIQAEAVASMFPQLLGGRDADQKTFKESIEETIGTNGERLTRFYASRGKAFPAAERLTFKWASYRWL
jgi:hypothetical protein